ncbi:MAG: PAS domain S-box protein [Alphaproteobacteria bacterium]|nr:PAS domain S-box protein [Alphaproteobacteria bacterium]
MANVQGTRLNRPRKKGKTLWLTSGLAQAMVLMNGIIITITAFFVLSYFINDMSVAQYRRISNDAGQSLVSGVSRLESAMRLVSTIILLSDTDNQDELITEIRKNVPDISQFDQLLWLYEQSPGNWKSQTISESLNNSDEDRYRLFPNRNLITKLLSTGFLKDEDLRIFYDLDGMEYKQERADPVLKSRSFAFLKTVKNNNHKLGIVVGVTRAPKIFDEEGSLLNSHAVSQLTINDSKENNPIFFMDHKAIGKSSKLALAQNFSFSVANSEWTVELAFVKESNLILLERMPLVILFFGTILTAVGTLFIRNNHQQSQKLGNMNYTLEQKNYELQAEVSERERLNEALALAERDNREIIDSVSDVIFEIDKDGDVLFLSKSWFNITGFEIERSMGSNLFSVLYPEDQEKQRMDFQTFVNGQKQAYRSFTRLRVSDGTFRAIELSISMIRKNKNEDMRIVGTITDVEERRRAERALAEAEKKYRTIVENAAGGLYQLTPEGIYLSANPAMARILGYEHQAEMFRIVKSAHGKVYPNVEERQKFLELLKVQEQVFGYETQVKHKDGTLIWVRENVRLVKDQNDNILYYEGSMEDITKRKEADIALLEAKMQSDMANRAKTEFIANMSHELRTPLNAIIGFSDIMKNEVMGPLGQETYKDYANDIHKSGVGLLKIINEILDISKIEAGEKDLNESEFALSDVIKATIDLFGSRLKEKDLTLVNEMKDLPYLLGEELSIKQVICNIYTNAIKYTPEKGRITFVGNYDDRGDFRFSITDTGIGMGPREIRKALSPFGQVDNALDRTGSGVGLGLPLAQAIMGVHGGKIEILSEKSIGTTVTIIFPHDRVIKSKKKEKT